MEVIILDNSKVKFKFKLTNNENDLILSLEPTEITSYKKYELTTTLEKLIEFDKDFSCFQNIDIFIKVLKKSLEANQYSLKIDEEINCMNLEIKNIFFEKGFATIQIREKEKEIENSVHIGDIVTTIRNLSNDDNWLECKGQEIDAKKYPKLVNLLGEEFLFPEWYLCSINEHSYYTPFVKSKTYYSSLKRKNNYFYLTFTNNKFSNNWSSINLNANNYYFKNLVYINNTWIIIDENDYKAKLWYCSGDMPTKLKEIEISSECYPCCSKCIVYGNRYYVICAKNKSGKPVIFYKKDLIIGIVMRLPQIKLPQIQFILYL